MDHALRRAGWVLCLAAGSAAAQPAPPASSDTQALRRELDALRADYENRIQALEQRLKAAEAALATAPPAPPNAPPAEAPVPANATAAVAPAPTRTGGGFQPDVSLILSGQYGTTRQDPATYRIRGFPLPPDAEIGPGTRGFSLNETELS